MKAKTLTLLISLSSLLMFASCGTSKSTNTDVIEQASVVPVSPVKPFANCNRNSTADLTMNLANIIGSNGAPNVRWVKAKFQFLSSNITKDGNYLRFYKWRVINNAAQLDENPLQAQTYDLASSTTTSQMMTDIVATDIDLQTGFYIDLRDDEENKFQVLKVVAYKEDGTVISQMNILIPEFAASPEDYKKNSDGTTRAQLLQQLHPLYGTDVSGWTNSRLEQNFQQHCF